ncbi:hypothetical protein DSL72_007302 [Monilinia vaccinii-corymbosi]|uniref:Delta 8-(E)-sphingolipid desaturase n=1 Tax=Monilinia vaccinii-corymbosi TaxID=61207 RepID=A0A8A3PL97_9HELO|nr:hypothetical protein DSL72_007302 [Monilinia vaccinii-corymbosi]
MMNSSFEVGSAKVWPLREIRELVEQGHAIVISEGYVLKLDSWLNRHPGGAKVILHVVGRDATVELDAFHNKDVKAKMHRYRIGRLEEPWVNIIPPFQRQSLRAPENETEKEPSTPTSEIPLVDATVTENLLAVPRLATNPDSDTSSMTSSIFDHEGLRSRFQTEGSSVDSEDILEPESKVLDASELEAKFQTLVAKLEDEGLYDTKPSAYISEILRCTILFALSMGLLRVEWYAASAAFLGMFWHQIVATAHDAGHMAVTHDYNIDFLIGGVVLNFCGGLSIGWWKRNHNIHHIVTNSPTHDQDLQILPFIAISPEFFDSLYSTASESIMHYNWFAKFMVPKQAWTYYFLLSVARFNLYYLAWDFILRDLGNKIHRKQRIFELVGQVFFWTWFGYFLIYRSIPTNSQRLIFCLICHMITLPLHLQLTVSHFSMSTEESEPSEHWIQRMFRTTMDVDCPTWLDWFHGGLQFQVTHHLFPRMPRHNLRKASGFVKEFCADTGLKYEVYGFGESNTRLLDRLAEVARQARYLKDCQDSIVSKGEYLHGHWD